jgi:outer membrane protein assembly factor BamB
MGKDQDSMQRRVQGHLSKIASFTLLAIFAVGCSSIPNPMKVFDRGGDEKEIEKNAEEQAKRIPVLAVDEALKPDPRFADLKVQLPPPYINADWPQPGGDPDHTMHHLGASPDLRKAWSADVGSGSPKRSPLISPPIIAEGMVFTIDTEARISAFDVQTGKRQWRTVLTPDVKEKKSFWKFFSPNVKPRDLGFGGGVAYDEGKVFAASGFGFVAALDVKTGEMLWQKDTPAPVRGAPTAYAGKVFVLTNSNEFVAYSQKDGAEEWNYQSFEEAARFLAPTSAAADGDVVIAPFSSGQITALRVENGRELWTDTLGRSSRRNALSNLSDIAGSPVIDRGLVFVASHAGEMRAIDLRTGEAVWEISLGTLQTPWVAGNYIFVLTTENILVSLNREDGAVIWKQQLPRYENEKKRKNRISWSGPVVAGGQILLVSTNGTLLGVSPQNGETVSKRKVGKGSMTIPVVASETVFVLDSKGKLFAFR